MKTCTSPRHELHKRSMKTCTSPRHELHKRSMKTCTSPRHELHKRSMKTCTSPRHELHKRSMHTSSVPTQKHAHSGQTISTTITAPLDLFSPEELMMRDTGEYMYNNYNCTFRYTHTCGINDVDRNICLYTCFYNSDGAG